MPKGKEKYIRVNKYGGFATELKLVKREGGKGVRNSSQSLIDNKGYGQVRASD